MSLSESQIAVIIAASRDRMANTPPAPVGLWSAICTHDEAQDHIDQYYLDADRTVMGIPAPLNFN